jgi:hypothetical protein
MPVQIEGTDRILPEIIPLSLSKTPSERFRRRLIARVQVDSAQKLQ